MLLIILHILQIHKPTLPNSWPAIANCKPSKTSSGSSKTSYDYGRCDTGPKNESAVTSRLCVRRPVGNAHQHALTAADIRDPDLDHQHLTANRALQQLNRIRRVELTTNNHRITITTRRTPLQTQALTAIGVDTHTWNKATIT